jgi:trehalose synthase-fused probable maltokinase
MSEAARLAAALDEGALVEWLVGRRWFGSKSREVAGASLVESAPLREGEPAAVLALVEVRFQPGTHETYHVLLGFRPEGTWHEEVVATVDGHVAYDGYRDPELARGIVELMRGGATLAAGEGELEFASLGELASVGEIGEARAVGAEQSNSSIVFGDALIMKAYRKVEPGLNPELELLRFLTGRGFANVPPLHGWFSYSGRLMDTTLGVLQRFVKGRSDGWDFALQTLRDDPEEFVRQAHRLGEVTGAMHAALASERDDPAFCPEEPSLESLALLTASVDEQIEQVFLDLPESETVAPIAGRAQEVRDQLQQLSHLGPLGRLIRHHGDYHLGQVLWTGEDFMVLDFEGEPARPILERRRKRSPLRDVAGMLRSFAYARFASEFETGVEPPAGWETAVREQFLDGYMAEVDPSLLPSGQEAIDRLLAVFELEKAVYELRYELDNRPDWVRIPVAGIERLLEVA